MKENCAKCGRTETLIAKGMCRKCYDNTRRTTCSICRKWRPAAKNTDKGPVCGSCVKKLAPDAVCVQCGRLKRPNKKCGEGFLCSSCSRPVEPCSECGRKKKVQKRIDGKPLCSGCYRRSRSGEICRVCGKTRVPNSRNEDGPICVSCYDKNIRGKKTCCRCGHMRKVDVCTKAGPLCRSCQNHLRAEADDNIRLRQLIHGRVRQAFLHAKHNKSKRSVEYGVDFEAILNHLGPCPGARHEWHIDHVIPISAFDFSNPLHIRAAFLPENHQWLTAADNFRKHAKFRQEDFEALLDMAYRRQ